MKSGGSKAKGSAFERLICKRLSLWLSNNQSDDLLWRTSLSGGRATIGLNKDIKRSAQAGDIGAISAKGEAFTSRYIVECKHYKDLQIPSAVFGSTGHFVDFWQRLIVDAGKFEKKPMLIAKQNNRPIIICVDHMGFVDLFDVDDYEVDQIIFNVKNLGAVHLFDFDWFIDNTEFYV
jgi:hypothetical protein